MGPERNSRSRPGQRPHHGDAVSPPATSSRARCWRTARRGAGDWASPGSGATAASEPSRSLPSTVNGLTGAVALAAGYGHTCALLSNATLRCWGENREGQLGNGTTANPGTAQPVAVSGITGATAITTGAYHTCALLGNGTVRCWGRNGQGQLGNGTFTNSSTPVAVSGLTGVAAVSGGGVHTCAVLTDGTVRCWGENEFGQLGNGTTATCDHAGAGDGNQRRRRRQRRVAPHLRAPWGRHGAVLGAEPVRAARRTGRTANRTTPVPVSGITGAVGVTAGWWHHSCALLGSGTVRCWGTNEWGQFGNGTTTSSSTPVTMTGPGVTWASSNTAVATIDADRTGNGRESRNHDDHGHRQLRSKRQHDAHGQWTDRPVHPVGRSRGRRHGQRELESAGDQLRHRLFRALQQRHQRDPDGECHRRIHA